MFNLNKINPYIRVAMHSVIPCGIMIKRRIIFDYELIYIERGNFTFIYDDKVFDTGENTFILIRPGIHHSFENINEDLSQPHIHFDMSFCASSKETPVSFKDFDSMSAKEKALIREDIFSAYPRLPYVSFNDTDAAKELFFGVINAFSNGDRLTAKGRLCELIEMLLRDNAPELLMYEDSNHYDLAKQIKDYLDSHEGIKSNLESLEKYFSYSRFYLERQFKSKYGVSIIAYRNEQRFELARELLKSKTATAVAQELGFGSVYSFSRAFKKRFGASPSSIHRQKE